MNFLVSNLHFIFKINMPWNGVKFVSSRYIPIINKQEGVVVESEIYEMEGGIN